jgi:hypothetical protein
MTSAVPGGRAHAAAARGGLRPDGAGTLPEEGRCCCTCADSGKGMGRSCGPAVCHGIYSVFVLGSPRPAGSGAGPEGHRIVATGRTVGPRVRVGSASDMECLAPRAEPTLQRAPGRRTIHPPSGQIKEAA